MRILITGAAGFIGEFVLQEIIRRRHHAVAMVRAPAPARWAEFPQIEVLQCDLGLPVSFDLRNRGVDAIVHLAAALQGSVDQQTASTIRGTENVLRAASDAGICHVVGISSVAVIDFVAARAGSLIDEGIDVHAENAEMSVYASLKREQERLFAEFGQKSGNGCYILRPGLVYDETRLSPAHAGLIQPPLFLLASHDGEVPTVEVSGLSRAIVNAAEIRLNGCEIINVVDDALPRQGDYLSELRRRGLIPSHAPTLPWHTLSRIAGSLGTLASVCGLGALRPEMLKRHSLSARIKPFRYSNAKAKMLLKWEPCSVFSRPRGH